MPMSYVVTANRLTDGRVVFKSADGSWSLELSRAIQAVTQASSAPMLSEAEADAARQLVVDPYVIEIDDNGHSPRPTKLREAIRAFGPTIAYAPVPFLEAAE